ncbi:hypothetical protein EJ04DRAFT_580987 [Polyplosphaeria fusca]|uniref:NACHT domain-containing protein n=1 Tax=Polyplosphaeria fusca TaxID=682080 RepID=A0A9P4QPZ3_9PLEO|nr:hypothetical protein EJ04DRAFT_580987 [Polyplosphaeria fusca]
MSTQARQAPFHKAKEAFIQSLGPRERSLFAKCDSVEELFDDARKIPELLKPKDRGSALLGKLAHFAERLKPYFEIVGIVVQSHPEFASLVWGAVRLLLQLAGNYANFFESFVHSLDRIAVNLESLQNGVILLQAYPQMRGFGRLEKSLAHIYSDLFAFFQAVVKIFTRKDGSRNSAPIIVGKLFWKPFDERFKELLDSIALHRQVVVSVIELMRWELEEKRDEQLDNNMNLVKEQLEFLRGSLRQLDQRLPISKDQVLRKIEEWLMPPDFFRDFQRARDLREEGTATWLFNLEHFDNWLHLPIVKDASGFNQDQVDTTLLIKGNPGCGKTVLSAASIDYIKSRPSEPENNVLYFFFRAGNSGLQSRLDAYCALLTQLLHLRRHDNDFIDKIAFAMVRNPSGQVNRPTESSAFEMLAMCTTVAIENGYIILDAIDECSDSEQLLSDVRKLSTQAGVKVLLFSRPNLKALNDILSPRRSISVDRGTMDDIKLFFDRKLNALEESGLLTHDFDREIALERLTRRADGMFLWAYLMMTYLRTKAITRRRRLETIMSTSDPEGLEPMYDRISEMICSQSQLEKEMAQRSISFVAFARQPLDTKDFESALSIWNHPEIDEEERLDDFLGTIIGICGGIMELVQINSSFHGRIIHSLQFIHLSARHYFTTPKPWDRPWSTSRLYLSASTLTSNLDIARVCLVVLALAKSESRASATPYTPRFEKTLIAYAATSWIQHLVEAKTGALEHPYAKPAHLHAEAIQLTFCALKEFLSQPQVTTSWIEISYTVGHTPEARELQEWASQVPLVPLYSHPNANAFDRTLDDLIDLSRYLIKMDDAWGDTLRRTPDCVWDEIPAFLSSRFLAKSSATTINRVMEDENERQSPASASLTPLCKVTLDKTGSMAILSVWPSRAYEMANKRGEIPIELPLFRELCMNWYARYELWSTEDPPQRTLQFWIPLEPIEIELQIQQSIARSWQKTESRNELCWALQVPLTMSPTLDMFVVLRTVFKIKRTENTVIDSYTLSTELHSYGNYWRPSTAALKELLREVRFHNKQSPLGFKRSPIYNYWCIFGLDDKYICFVDRQDQAVTVAIYLIDANTTLDVSYISHFSTRIATSRPLMPAPNVILHPNLDLLAMSFGERAFVWAFRLGEGAYGVLDHLGRGQGLTFSQCGNYVMEKAPDQTLPTVAPIPTYLKSLSSPKKISYMSSQDISLKTAYDVGAQVVEPSYSLEQLSRPGQALQTTGQVSGRGTSSSGMMLSHADTHLGLQVWKSGNSEGSEQVDLIRLPRHAGRDSSITSYMPDSSDGKMKIVFNMASKPYNNLHPSAEEAVPLVAYRKLSAIQRSYQMFGNE